jgi:hypothetical protein
MLPNRILRKLVSSVNSIFYNFIGGLPLVLVVAGCGEFCPILLGHVHTMFTRDGETCTHGKDKISRKSSIQT